MEQPKGLKREILLPLQICHALFVLFPLSSSVLIPVDGSERLEYVYLGMERVGCRALGELSFSAFVALRRVT